MRRGTAGETSPSIDGWLREAKEAPGSQRAGMFLVHRGVVRQTPKDKARKGIDNGPPVTGMDFSYDAAGVDAAIAKTREMEGITFVRVWLNQGRLKVGDDIMQVLIAGDIRPRVVNAMGYLVEKIKSECVTESEIRDKQKTI